MRIKHGFKPQMIKKRGPKPPSCKGGPILDCPFPMGIVFTKRRNSRYEIIKLELVPGTPDRFHDKTV